MLLSIGVITLQGKLFGTTVEDEAMWTLGMFTILRADLPYHRTDQSSNSKTRQNDNNVKTVT